MPHVCTMGGGVTPSHNVSIVYPHNRYILSGSGAGSPIGESRGVGLENIGGIVGEGGGSFDGGVGGGSFDGGIGGGSFDGGIGGGSFDGTFVGA